MLSRFQCFFPFLVDIAKIRYGPPRHKKCENSSTISFSSIFTIFSRNLRTYRIGTRSSLYFISKYVFACGCCFSKRKRSLRGLPFWLLSSCALDEVSYMYLESVAFIFFLYKMLTKSYKHISLRILERYW